jgi:hypothetical protein
VKTQNGKVHEMTVAQAKAHCRNLNVPGIHLPTLKDFDELTKLTHGKNLLPGFGTNTVWSTTPESDGNTDYLFFDGEDFGGSTEDEDKKMGVMCVFNPAETHSQQQHQE